MTKPFFRESVAAARIGAAGAIDEALAEDLSQAPANELPLSPRLQAVVALDFKKVRREVLVIGAPR